MSGFYIFKDGSDRPIEVTSRGLISALADPCMVGHLFFALKPGVIVPVELKDGPATIQRVPRKEQPSQQRLMLPQPLLPIQPYRAQCNFKFIIPLEVDCRGESPVHVRETIKDVVHGQRGVPQGFNVLIRTEEISALLGRIESCDMSVIADVEVISVSPYYLLNNERGG